MKISARNAFKGMVKKVKPGLVNAEDILEVASGIGIVAVITKASTTFFDGN